MDPLVLSAWGRSMKYEECKGEEKEKYQWEKY